MLSADPTMSRSVYYRVMILGCVDAILTLPISIFMLATDIIPLPDTFYPGWRKEHSGFSTIPTTRASEWSKDTMSTLSVKWDLWVNPFVAISVFVLLGLTREARATYRRLFWRVMRPLGIKEPPAQIFVTSEMRFGTVGGRGVTFNDSRWVHTYHL